MRNILLSFFLLLTFLGKAQNLVPNPSFEDTLQCPHNGWIEYSQGWKSFSSSPDYYNNCVPELFGYSVPNNFTGIQLAASGQAYAGAICYIEGETDYSLNREILGNNLISPLLIGQKYFVSLKIAAIPNTFNIGSSMFIDKLGVLFSSLEYTNLDSNTIPPIQNFAHVFTDSIITDTTNWTTIFGSFTADSAYTYISIGNFFKNNNTDTIHHTNSTYPNAYYLFDDICVSTDSSFCLNYVYIGINDEIIMEQNLNVYPNPTSDFVNLTFDDNEIHSVVIFNSIGAAVLVQNVFRKININISNLEQGVYYIHTNTSSHLINKKLIIY
ncbi:MAG TPA: T9SS type A sorting domain-containing protein [Bacteroidia bacterium]|jgi:hypothetical protein